MHYTQHLHDSVSREPSKHEKKILHKYFIQIVSGRKKFEIRKEDDCVYNVNDIITLHEINDDGYTGRKVDVKVTSKLSHNDFPQGIVDGHVILSIDTKGNIYK